MKILNETVEGKLMNKYKTAQPIYVSECIECVDEHGHYIGETSVILNVQGDCVSKVYNGRNIESLNPPIARGAVFHSVKYETEKDFSVIEYRFHNGPFINRFNTSRRFVNKMKKQIDAQKIKDFTKQLVAARANENIK